MSEITKFCITCEREGHTYLECPELSFGDILCSAFGIANIPEGKTAQEARDSVSEFISQSPTGGESE